MMRMAIPTHAEDSINEKFGLPIVVYGDILSDAQKQEVRYLLGLTDPNNVQEYSVTGQDIANYINGDPNSNMYSSAKIVMENEGTGLTIDFVTRDNIMLVTYEMYSNAIL